MVAGDVESQSSDYDVDKQSKVQARWVSDLNSGVQASRVSLQSVWCGGRRWQDVIVTSYSKVPARGSVVVKPLGPIPYINLWECALHFCNTILFIRINIHKIQNQSLLSFIQALHITHIRLNCSSNTTVLLTYIPPVHNGRVFSANLK